MKTRDCHLLYLSSHRLQQGEGLSHTGHIFCSSHSCYKTLDYYWLSQGTARPDTLNSLLNCCLVFRVEDSEVATTHNQDQLLREKAAWATPPKFPPKGTPADPTTRYQCRTNLGTPTDNTALCEEVKVCPLFLSNIRLSLPVSLLSSQCIRSSSPFSCQPRSYLLSNRRKGRDAERGPQEQKMAGPATILAALKDSSPPDTCIPSFPAEIAFG